MHSAVAPVLRGLVVLIYSWYCGIGGIEWRWHLLSRQLDELTAQMIEVRQQSSSTAMNEAVKGLTEAVRTVGQSVSKPRPEDMRVGMLEPYALGKDFDDSRFTVRPDGRTPFQYLRGTPYV